MLRIKFFLLLNFMIVSEVQATDKFCFKIGGGGRKNFDPAVGFLMGNFVILMPRS